MEEVDQDQATERADPDARSSIDGAQGQMPISKTRRKAQMHAIQSVGERLIDASDSLLGRLELPDRLHDAIVQARGMKAREARRRQVQFIGKLMRGVDTERIEQILDEDGRSHRMDVESHHAAERWRDQLVDGTVTASEFIDRFPAAVHEPIARLVQQARREATLETAPPHARRNLFRALHRVLSSNATALDDGSSASDASQTRSSPPAVSHPTGSPDVIRAGIAAPGSGTSSD